jgi:predicted nucleotidyltransferase
MMNYGLSESTFHNLVQVFRSFDKIEKAILYGSRVKNTHKSGSDIDIALVGRELTINTLDSIEMKIEELVLPHKVDISIFHLIENSDLIDHILRVGQVIYSRVVE